ncbi:30S ribosomal protein S12 methylthiotransferase RimO [Collinsella sp. zg1085]|uniref:30S ribosomal protein S12 methylthiotransferase RimO n=1 Tax=Collinsella sp. zg1085 TaxID=2844380 RepID=UPI001C0C375A|nr:30S ribosomal protein S12 methylthiotransferase RimO [Collinsella sp. zg1085]QWT16991.1 30S ribosomal protein S12 methylthiotransferase RimO [Collinsella sp. zg1085]
MSLGSLHYITLGCAKNEVDTDRMRSLLSAAGYTETDSPQEAAAVLINTCSFLAAATTESLEATFEVAREADGLTRRPQIIMCGCVPSRYGQELNAELPEVAAFVNTREEDAIVSVVDSVLGIKRSEPPHLPKVKRTVESAVAYLKISDGCDRFCSFCAIPYIRGAYQSRSAAQILAEAQELVAGGVRELVLIGQDTGVWGSDFDERQGATGPKNLAQLLVYLAEALREQQVWIRVLYLQPEGMTEELVAAIRDTPEVLPYIDIPVQHVSKHVLADMNRTGSEAELRELFRWLRSEIPHMVIRTTYLAGFPGETDKDAEDMLHFMTDLSFDYTSVFAYSREEGTSAYDMDNQVADDVILARTQAGLDVAEELGFASTAAHVGETALVLIDGIDEGDEGPELIGHAWFQAPDSDGAVHLPLGEASVGDIVMVKFDDSVCYELMGHVVRGTE